MGAPPRRHPFVKYRDINSTIFLSALNTSNAASTSANAAPDHGTSTVQENAAPSEISDDEDMDLDTEDTDLDEPEEVGGNSIDDDAVPFAASGYSFDIDGHIDLTSPELLDYLSDTPRTATSLSPASAQRVVDRSNRISDDAPITHVAPNAFRL
jgi:hypothetical protein